MAHYRIEFRRRGKLSSQGDAKAITVGLIRDGDRYQYLGTSITPLDLRTRPWMRSSRFWPAVALQLARQAETAVRTGSELTDVQRTPEQRRRLHLLPIELDALHRLVDGSETLPPLDAGEVILEFDAP